MPIPVMIFSGANVAYPLLWGHALNPGDVGVPFQGTTNIHITPDITSPNIYGSVFRYSHPNTTARKEMVGNEAIIPSSSVTSVTNAPFPLS